MNPRLLFRCDRCGQIYFVREDADLCCLSVTKLYSCDQCKNMYYVLKEAYECCTYPDTSEDYLEAVTT